MNSLENHTRIHTKIGKVWTRFQTNTAQKTIIFGAANTYKANIRKYPPPPPWENSNAIPLCRGSCIMLALK